MDLLLPEPVKPPPGVRLSFAGVRVRGDRTYVSGHGPLNPDGSPAKPFGKVGVEVSPEEGYEAARLTVLTPTRPWVRRRCRWGCRSRSRPRSK